MSEVRLDIGAIRDFIYREAALIDSKSFDAWYELFTEDALYWMPLERGQAEDDLTNALFFEDKFLLKVRLERLHHPRAFSQSPPSYCQHVLQRPAVVPAQMPEAVDTVTPFIYVESQGDEQIVLAGTAHHRLLLGETGPRIHRKRIELLNRDAALPSIQLFL